MRDEEIVIYRRRGLSVWQIADALGHPHRVVLAVVRDVDLGGIDPISNRSEP